LGIRGWGISSEWDLKVVLVEKTKIKVSQPNVKIEAEVHDTTRSRLARHERLKWGHATKIVWQERVVSRRGIKM
jgi:hypothetical protein